jgi:DNA-binding Xre family transcriptional regulator
MVSYKPLFKLLVDRNMSKADLRRLAEISPNTMTKLRRGEEVSMSILNKICSALQVSYGDIMEYVHLENSDQQ